MLEPRPWIAQISPYRPGAHADPAGQSLASNESPFGPPPIVEDAIRRGVSTLNRYPDPSGVALREAIARRHGVDPEWVLLGNGSDELIYVIALAYLAGGGTALVAEPGYRLDVLTAQIVNAHTIGVPLDDWVHDLAAMSERRADVAFVVNPHNPTGTVVRADRLSWFVEHRAASLVVVDEAYIDFADETTTASAVGLIDRGDVIVLRTFSKMYGLAGLRVGYLLGAPSLVRTMAAVRAPFSVGTLNQMGAVAALDASAHYRSLAAGVASRREALTRMLRECGLEVVDSQANFVLVHSVDEARLVSGLARRGVAVRGGRSLGVENAVRISVPSADGLAAVRDALEQIDLHSCAIPASIGNGKASEA